MGWLVIDDQGYVQSFDAAEPGEQPAGYEVVEWYGDVEWEVYDTIILPDGTEAPLYRGIDPRPAGYSSGRDRFEEMRDAIDAELVWLDETIPLIGTMNEVQVRSVVNRLAQENRQMIRAWRYLANRLDR